MNAAARPISAFLSHAGADGRARLIAPLEEEIELRGAAVWRDVHRLLPGQHNWEEIQLGINEATMFIQVATPRSVTRPSVWREIEMAHARREREPGFPIAVVRIGISREDLDEACVQYRVRPLSVYQQHEVTLDPSWRAEQDPGWAQRAARQLLGTAVQQRVREDPERSLMLAIRSSTTRTAQVPDLDLDWSGCFTPEPDAETWGRLLAALMDVADAVTSQTRQPRIAVAPLARLGAGYALGWAIPRTSGRALDIIHADKRQTWASDAAPNDDGRTEFIEETDADGEPQLAGVLLSVGRDARELYQRSDALRRVGRLLEVRRPAGADLTAESAAYVALRIGDAIRGWCDSRGVTEVHIFGAGPIGLAVLIGRQLNATVDVTVFHDQGGVYTAACRLPVGSKGTGTVLAAVHEEELSLIQRALRLLRRPRIRR